MAVATGKGSRQELQQRVRVLIVMEGEEMNCRDDDFLMIFKVFLGSNLEFQFF